MRIPVPVAAQQLEARGALARQREDHSGRIIPYVQALLNRPLPEDLVAFYQARIVTIGEFSAHMPRWNDRVGWRSPDDLVTELLEVDAVPLFGDGCGNLFGLDLTPGLDVPAVYFFDHERGFEKPEYAAGSSLGAFMLLLADHDRACHENWPPRWELAIDPDLESCPRAPAIWAAD